MNALFEFVTFSFPKAGTTVAGLGLTLNLILFAIILLWNFRYLPTIIDEIPYFSLPYVILLGLGLGSILLNVGEKSIENFWLAGNFIILASPLSMVALFK
ncbi:MAG: hypothetical protein LBD38_02525 [Streptococcaceae bacterium]|jgi:hypothetical protein|nr:hypothetical protein [Streptococcaceae bacterium]